jgi:hypothetical protein
MKAVRIVTAVILGLVGLLLGTLLFAPASVMRPLANYLMSDSGVEITAIEDLQLGWRSSSALGLQAQLPGVSLAVRELSATYQLADLISQARVANIDIGHLELVVDDSTGSGEQPADSPLQFKDLLTMAQSLPFARLAVNEFSVQGEVTASGSVAVTSRPLQLVADLTSNQWPGWLAELRLQQVGNSRVSGTASLQRQQQTVLSTDLDLELTTDRAALATVSEIDLQVVQGLPFVSGPMGDARLTDSKLRVSSELSADLVDDTAAGMDAELESLALERLEIDTGDGGLNWQLANGNVQGELVMPLTVTGALDRLGNTFSLNLGSARSSLAIGSAALTGDGEIVVADFQLDCDFQRNCSGLVQTELNMASWQAAELDGDNAVLSGGLAMASDSDGVSLRAASLTLELPLLNYLLDPAGQVGTGRAELALQDLQVTMAEEISASLTANTQRLDLELSGIDLVAPAISTQLRLDGNALSGTVNLRLGQRLDSSLSFAHAIDSGIGELAFSLEPLQFTDADPMSSLLSIASVDADIVGGTLSGSANLAWQQTASGWLLSGPMTVNMDELSGFAADVFFVGFSSSLRAELREGNLQSAGLLPATVATLDVGLPMDRIDWQYGFDLGDGTLTINGLSTEMLGGTVEIPSVVYDMNATENRVRVVLSRLDLATIVALANYPNLQVSGTVSGYLPLLITPEGVALEDGLLSALNPGGSIRYTPSSPAGSNASVEILNEALSNYLFETLNAEAEYGADGDLELAVQLRGRNPDMRGGQPINLNINIADNIPALLRSLQAGRVITERLEQRLNRQ